MVLLELNGNPDITIKMKQNLQQLQPQALQEHICKHATCTLPESWHRAHLRESDLALSIDGVAITRNLHQKPITIDGEMSLHQNGQCCLSDGCDPLSLSARVCLGVIEGTVVTVIVLDTAAGRWHHQHARQFFKLGRAGGGSVDGQQYTKKHCYIKAVEIDDQHTDAWDRLGFLGGGSSGGQQYTKHQCFARRDELKAAAKKADDEAAAEEAATTKKTGEEAAAAKETTEEAAATKETTGEAAAAKETTEDAEAAAAKETTEEATAAKTTGEEAAAAKKTGEEATPVPIG